MESGDLIMALDEAGWNRVVELQAVAAAGGRRTDVHEISIFKSNGLALEDVAAAAYVYERATEAGAGKSLYS
jgi:ornithine cyclodeaminase/alanine dehydrogenase-like protein (mu-crystallin family)